MSSSHTGDLLYSSYSKVGIYIFFNNKKSKCGEDETPDVIVKPINKNIERLEQNKTNKRANVGNNCT